MQIDRSFFDKFNSQPLLNNVKELGKSVVHEITCILNSRLSTTLQNSTSIKSDPFNYGIAEITSIKGSEDCSHLFMPHIKKCILDADPRIDNLYISNVYIDLLNQIISFDIKFTLKNFSSTIVTNIKVNK